MNNAESPLVPDVLLYNPPGLDVVILKRQQMLTLMWIAGYVRTAFVLSSKTLILVFFYFCVFQAETFADTSVSTTDSLVTILKQTDKEIRNQQLMVLLYKRFHYSSAFDGTKSSVEENLRRYGKEDAASLVYYINGLINRRQHNFNSGEDYLLKAIASAQKTDNKYFLYQFYSILAFLQTDKGDPLGAIHSYQLARKEAEFLQNPVFLAKNAIGLSDIYTKIELYDKALHFLDLAQVASTSSVKNDTTLFRFIDFNKAEIYFKLGNADSLRFYRKRFSKAGDSTPDLRRMHMIADYFSLILEGKYKEAIYLIQQVLLFNHYNEDMDQWNLADCYYKIHQMDSAKKTALYLVNDQRHGTTQIRYKSFRLLAKIAADENNLQEAQQQIKRALLERDEYVRRLIQVGDLSAQMRLDELESSYLARTLRYQKQRTILIFAIILVLLMLVIIGMFYLNVRQKGRYEKLLNENRNQQIALLNSHKVRKHLENILGLCTILNEHKTDEEDTELYHQHLLSSALELEKSLKEVETKLREIS